MFYRDKERTLCIHSVRQLYHVSFRTVNMFIVITSFSILFSFTLFLGINSKTTQCSFHIESGDFDIFAIAPISIDSLSSCAAKCRENHGCISVLYSKYSNGCQLIFSVLTTSGSSSNPSWELYVIGKWKCVIYAYFLKYILIYFGLCKCDVWNNIFRIGSPVFINWAASCKIGP